MNDIASIVRVWTLAFVREPGIYRGHLFPLRGRRNRAAP
jgi:hypothetical protein